MFTLHCDSTGMFRKQKRWAVGLLCCTETNKQFNGLESEAEACSGDTENTHFQRSCRGEENDSSCLEEKLAEDRGRAGRWRAGVDIWNRGNTKGWTWRSEGIDHLYVYVYDQRLSGVEICGKLKTNHNSEDKLFTNRNIESIPATKNHFYLLINHTVSCPVWIWRVCTFLVTVPEHNRMAQEASTHTVASNTQTLRAWDKLRPYIDLNFCCVWYLGACNTMVWQCGEAEDI